VKEESEEPQGGEQAQAVKTRLTIVAVLSMLLGVLATVIAVGAFFHYRQDQSLRAEMLAAKNELTQKSRILDEMKDEIATLSRQMYALRDHSIARSGSGDRSKNGPSAPSVEPAAAAVDAAAATSEAPAPVAVAAAKPKRVKAKPDGQSCELVGKSPAEQAAILQRCVGMMDSKPAPRPGKAQ